MPKCLLENVNFTFITTSVGTDCFIHNNSTFKSEGQQSCLQSCHSLSNGSLMYFLLFLIDPPKWTRFYTVIYSDTGAKYKIGINQITLKYCV